jgi:hypothetical protein
LRGGAVGDDAAEGGGAGEADEHREGGGNFGDGVFAVALAGELGGHDAKDVGAVMQKDDAGIVAHGFELSGFIGDLQGVG